MRQCHVLGQHNNKNKKNRTYLEACYRSCLGPAPNTTPLANYLVNDLPSGIHQCRGLGGAICGRVPVAPALAWDPRGGGPWHGLMQGVLPRGHFSSRSTVPGLALAPKPPETC
eukprot:1159480-Pelagomonas_calceolata.AAC.6